MVFSDGDDTSSLVTFEDVLTVAARGDVTVYAVRVGTRSPPSTLSGHQTSSWVGSRNKLEAVRSSPWRPASCLGRSRRCERNWIMNALAYVPTASLTDVRFRHLSVGITRPGARATTRLGYLATR